jgi:hypothetical protein
VALRHKEAKGKLRRDLQGEAMVAWAELTVRTNDGSVSTETEEER